MLLVPLSDRISWKNPPYLTLSLILLNCLVFFSFQLSDNRKQYETTVFYFESGLAEVEVRGYIDYLNGLPSNEGAVIDPDDVDEKSRYAYSTAIMADAVFLKKLRSGQIITAAMPHYSEWKAHRAEYDARMSDVVTYRFGFKPGFPTTATMFTHMFLHGGLGHLLGNMVFLWLAGCLVESAMKRPYFVPAYIFTGISAVCLFWAFHLNSGIPMVGASGAISGLMGMLTILYGKNRIKVFYSLGFYFNYLKVPAIILLPIWVGTELFYVFRGGPGNVAYLAHVGGFLGGAVAALSIIKVFRASKPEAIKEAPEDRSPLLIEQALKAAGELKIKEALGILDQALTEYPGHLEMLKHQYKIARMDPENTDFHTIAGKLLKAYCGFDGNYPKARELYDDYSKAVEKPRLSLQVYVRLTAVYISLGDTDSAEKFIALFLKRRSDIPELPVILLKLVLAFREKGNGEKHERYRGILLTRFPESREAALLNRPGQAVTPSA